MEEVGGEGAGGQRWQQWDHSFHPVTILMLPLRDLINDLNEGTEQEGAAVLRSNNQEGRQTGERKASSSQRLELRKHGWILLYDTVCGWDTAVPHLHTGSGCLAKWEHAGIIGASLVGVAPLHCETCSQRQQALGLTYLPAASSIT